MARATWGSTDLGGTIGTLSAGAKLRVAYWKGPADGPGTVVIAQGRGEAIEFYGEAIGDLLARGLSVVAFDFRGQGGSERRSARGGHIDRFSQYGEDLVTVVRFAHQLGLPRPVSVLAHSMGGLAALLAQPNLSRDVSRMVLLAPLLEIVDLPMSPTMVRFLVHGASLLGMKRSLVAKPQPPPTPAGFAANKLTSDPARYEALCAIAGDNPDLMLGPPTIGWMRAALKAMAAVRRRKGRPLAIPTLFIASGHDRVVSTAAIDAFARAAEGGGVVLVRGARHQLLFERDPLRDLFFAAFDAFVTDQPYEPVADDKRSRLARPLKFAPGSESEAAPAPAQPSRPDLDEEPHELPPTPEPAQTIVVNASGTAFTEAETPVAPPPREAPLEAEWSAYEPPEPAPASTEAEEPEPVAPIKDEVPEPAAPPPRPTPEPQAPAAQEEAEPPLRRRREGAARGRARADETPQEREEREERRRRRRAREAAAAAGGGSPHSATGAPDPEERERRRRRRAEREARLAAEGGEMPAPRRGRRERATGEDAAVAAPAPEPAAQPAERGEDGTRGFEAARRLRRRVKESRRVGVRQDGGETVAAEPMAEREGPLQEEPAAASPARGGETDSERLMPRPRRPRADANGERQS